MEKKDNNKRFEPIKTTSKDSLGFEHEQSRITR